MNADSSGVGAVFVSVTVSISQAPIAVHVPMAGGCWVMADHVKVFSYCIFTSFDS